MVLMFFFLNACLNLGPIMGIHGGLTTLLISSLVSLLYRVSFAEYKECCCKEPDVIFCQRCIYHNITPKSFRLKTPIKSRKDFNVMNVHKKKLIVIAKNNAKERIHNVTLKFTKHSKFTNCVKLSQSESVRGTLSPYSICYRKIKRKGVR